MHIPLYTLRIEGSSADIQGSSIYREMQKIGDLFIKEFPRKLVKGNQILFIQTLNNQLFAHHKYSPTITYGALHKDVYWLIF